MRRILLLPPVLYLTWLGMLLVHEFGHVLHASVSGGEVTRVAIPLLGFSQTFVEPNPRPHFVAWGGVVWGSVLPVIIWLILQWSRSPGRGIAQFFAGFCLIANGAYLGVGWMRMAGDAGDLVDYGTPVWVLVLVGIVGLTTGLLLWHWLGRPRALWTARQGVPR